MSSHLNPFSVPHLAEDTSSTNSPNIEYLADDDDFEALDEVAFNEFCASLHFDPFHPEGDNEMINELIGKRKREGEEISFASIPIEDTQASDQSSVSNDSHQEVQQRHSDSNKFNSFAQIPQTLKNQSPSEPLPISNQNTTTTTTNNPSKRARTSGPPPQSTSATSSSSAHSKPQLKMKIPKKDIRNNYAAIFARAFNTTDPEILQHCLQKYCVPDCRVVYKYVGAISPYGGENVEVIGIDAISKFWEVLFLSMPDAVFEIQENKLRVLPSGSCASVSKFIFSVTKVYKMTTDDNYDSVVYSAPAAAAAAVAVNSSLTTSTIRDTTVASSSSGSADHVNSVLHRSSPTSYLPAPVPDEAGKDSKYLVKMIPKSAVDYKEVSVEKSLKNISLASMKSEMKQQAAGSLPLPSIPPAPTASSSSAGNTANSGDIDQFGLTGKLEKPQMFIIIGTFTLFVNPEKKIYKFEFIHSIKP